MSTPQNEVDGLLSRINDENVLNRQHLIDGQGVPAAAAAAQQVGADDSLEARLATSQGNRPM